MTDYKKLYEELFNEITNTVFVLDDLQKRLIKIQTKAVSKRYSMEKNISSKRAFKRLMNLSKMVAEIQKENKTEENQNKP
ncbi:MAG: hypothetical protein FWG44_07670 [Oscillospiraceae bacterium]|nr:hypothetical protein [Oscillospiraceae bacterium]